MTTRINELREYLENMVTELKETTTDDNYYDRMDSIEKIEKALFDLEDIEFIVNCREDFF